MYYYYVVVKSSVGYEGWAGLGRTLETAQQNALDRARLNAIDFGREIIHVAESEWKRVDGDTRRMVELDWTNRKGQL